MIRLAERNFTPFKLEVFFQYDLRQKKTDDTFRIVDERCLLWYYLSQFAKCIYIQIVNSAYFTPAGRSRVRT